MITLLCDFCREGSMVAFYPCRSFALGDKEEIAKEACFPVLDYCSDSGPEGFEGWTACEICHKLIECAAIEALARRAHAVEKERNSESMPIDYYRAIFLSFFDHRTGPAYYEELEDVS